MCGLFYSSFHPATTDFSELDRRGPDYQDEISTELGYFYHSNLSTQINSRRQPLTNASGILLYNGTQYNLNGNDNQYLIDNLSNQVSHNIEFINSLLGDFALIWVTENFILLGKDFGGTKPLFYGLRDNRFCASSSELTILNQGFDPVAVDPNTILVFDRGNEIKLQSTHSSKIFNYSQTVTTFDRVIESFESSVTERFYPDTLVPLSSGLDSGAIAACLHKHKKSFCASTRIGHEDKIVLSNRYNLLKDCEKYVFDDINLDTIKKSMSDPREKFAKKYTIHQQAKQVAWQIAEYASSRGYRYVLSGTGGDEIYSDYGWNGIKYRPYSQFGGVFPADLSTIWPWPLDENLPLRYCIHIEDYVYGQFGMDTRNPYLDVRLIQHWLNLAPALKNEKYKYWQQQYLTDLGFPYTIADKKCLPIPPGIRKQVYLDNQRNPLRV